VDLVELGQAGGVEGPGLELVGVRRRGRLQICLTRVCEVWDSWDRSWIDSPGLRVRPGRLTPVGWPRASPSFFLEVEVEAGEQKRKRCMVFIDGSNLYHALKETKRSVAIDFAYLVGELVTSGRELVRVYYYNAPVNERDDPEQHKRQQRFLSRMRRLPYFEVKLGRLVRRKHGMIERGVDVRLATDMVAMGVRDHYDVAILVSGDGDFADAVQAVKDAGKHVELAFPKCKALSNQLLEACDLHTPLEDSKHFRPM